ncbi:unnamed protein product [Cuscuta epithymum]|uniref:Uncharacterized protein n=1 Tax=Cuscuta epithymum TaxID=186058 RepID=A0AAV0D9H9_9ASTE|nr:unnamed protein product [Cuscuta epithymum]
MDMIKGYSFFALFLVLTICISSKTAASVRSKDPLEAILGNTARENFAAWTNRELNAALTQAPSPATQGLNDTLLLAGDRTRRPDILSRFHKYKGGWDIVNKHYWASVGFTGAAGFILSVLWFAFFGLALMVHYCVGWRIKIPFMTKESRCSDRVCLIVLILFTCTAAIGCILLSIGQDKFRVESLDTLKFVVNQSDYAVLTLRNVTQYLTLAKTVKVAQMFLPSNAIDDIDRLNGDLNEAADTLEEKTNVNSSRIRRVFNLVRMALITVAAVMLISSLFGLCLSIRGHKHTIHIFIISGWLLVSVTLILCGVFVIINNVIADTCVAMGEWVDNPQAETALSNILPCVDQSTTNRSLIKSKQVVVDIVDIVNAFVDTYANSDPLDPRNSINYNQSGPLIPHLCYPYDSRLQDLPCPAQQVSMENSSLVWQNYICNVSEAGVCSSVGRLLPDMYRQLVAAVNISYALEHYAPPMLNLQNCNFVRDAFRNITSQHCPRLEREVRTVYAGLALISVGLMLSLALWMVYANRPRREEVFERLFKNRGWFLC